MSHQRIADAHLHAFDLRCEVVHLVGELGQSQRLFDHRVLDLPPGALGRDERLAGLLEVMPDIGDAAAEFLLEIPLHDALEQVDLGPDFRSLRQVRA